MRAWTVGYAHKADKQMKGLPEEIKELLKALDLSLTWNGPEQPKWPHYGKLAGKRKNQDIRHCHLNKGRPTYVVIWSVIDQRQQIMEIKYVGTHENADYRRLN
jgi:mRNA-degrading endonuclease RelE of RelBE toxin-antitoxin system